MRQRRSHYCTAGRLAQRSNCPTDAGTTESDTLSLHDALPILNGRTCPAVMDGPPKGPIGFRVSATRHRSEEHTSELQSHRDVVCRLLLEKKKGYAQSVREDAPPARTNAGTVTTLPKRRRLSAT